MKITGAGFKGTIPKTSAWEIPDQYAQAANTCRLTSGDLEPYKGTTDVLTFDKGSIISAIYPIDRDGTNGGPYWLNWTSAEASTGVEVAKGFDKDDNGAEFVYFTGTDRPRVTKRSMAINGLGNAYPYESYYLGLPIPSVALTAANAVSSSITADYTLDGASINDFSKGGGPNALIAVSGTQIQLSTTNQSASDAWISKDVGFSTVQFSRMTFRLQALTAKSNNLTAFAIPYGFSNTSDGGRVFLTHNSSNNQLRISLGTVSLDPTDPTDGPVAKAYSNQSGTTLISGAPNWGTAFDVQIDAKLQKVVTTSAGSERKFEVTVTVFTTAGVQLYTATVTNIVLTGGFIQFEAAAQVNSDNTPVSGTNQIGIDLIKVYLVGEADTSSLTNYVYVFVNSFGQESAPSPASNDVIAGEFLENTLTGFTTSGASANYGIIGYRLYRAVTGSLDTQYQFVRTADYITDPGTGVVDILPLSTVSTLDDNTDDQLEGVLLSLDWLEPPTDARNILALPNGIMIVTSGNLLCPSVQFRPHAYPESYKLATDFPIVGLAAIESSVVVMTQESTYVVTGSDPSALSMNIVSSIYGCISRRSIARWREYGIVYASKRGLVAVTPNGADLISKEFLTEREFAEYNPDTIHGVIYDDVYYGFYTDGGQSRCFSFDLRNQGVGIQDIDLTSTASFVEPISESMYVTQGAILKTWNTGADTTYQWTSKDYLLPYPASFMAAQIKMRNPSGASQYTTVDFYKDQDGSPFYTKVVSSDAEFVIPAVICKQLKYKLSGKGRIYKFSVATSVEELD